MKKYWLPILLLSLLPSVRAADAARIAVSLAGVLQTGVVAIGGETTGVVLTTKAGERYELDFGANAELAKKAAALDGRAIVVTGELTTQAGTELKERRIIRVATLAMASSAGNPSRLDTPVI